MAENSDLCIRSTKYGDKSVRGLWRPVADTEAFGAGIGSVAEPELRGKNCWESISEPTWSPITCPMVEDCLPSSIMYRMDNYKIGEH